MVGCGGSETSPGDTAAGLEGDAVETSSGVSSAPRVQAPPTVRIETSLGTITVVLEPEKAPLTVRNFLSYVDDGHYDGTIFHQVVDGYIVLGGGFTPEFEEKPVLEAIRNEAHNGLQNRRGTIAMARQADAIDSSTCQFFINLADNPELDHKDREAPEAYGYCVFGRVTEGLEVLDKIGKVQVQDREGFQMVPVQPVAIRSIKRWH
jgi:cyclophilin family peptidyl-prolyl cis-trans isomerase